MSCPSPSLSHLFPPSVDPLPPSTRPSHPLPPMAAPLLPLPLSGLADESGRPRWHRRARPWLGRGWPWHGWRWPRRRGRRWCGRWWPWCIRTPQWWAASVARHSPTQAAARFGNHEQASSKLAWSPTKGGYCGLLSVPLNLEIRRWTSRSGSGRPDPGGGRLDLVVGGQIQVAGGRIPTVRAVQVPASDCGDCGPWIGSAGTWMGPEGLFTGFSFFFTFLV